MERNANRIFDKKRIKLFEAFSGIGTQKMALEILAKELGLEIETVGYSEIDKFAIKSYEAIHGERIKNYGGIGSFERMPKDIDICTWSFPCQDISAVGKQKGMTEGSRSNYGYVFLDTIENTPYEERPKVLLMENVKALVGKKFKKDFTTILERLQQMGYKNFWKVLNAKHYGVPQNRERVFVVSILDDLDYEFPKPFPLEKQLKDYLETNVDEKYYLSDKMIDFFVKNSERNKQKGNGFRFTPKKINDINVFKTITTRSGSRMDDNFIIVPEKTIRGYKEAEDGDGVYINRPHQKRGVVQKGKIQTLTTRPDTPGVVVDQPPLRIRKLTPLEAWRLMGIDDEDFYKVKATGMSDAQLYKQAGNAIVVDVLYYIFKQMFT